MGIQSRGQRRSFGIVSGDMRDISCVPRGRFSEKMTTLTMVQYRSCVYTAFLALNGITEAFVYGVARSGNDVGEIGIAHAAIGGVFALIAPGFVMRHGSVGLIAANCVAMALRSAYSIQYERSYFSRSGKAKSVMGTLSRMFPHVLAMMAFGASCVISRVSSRRIYDAQIATGGSWIFAGAQHIGIGVVCVIITLSLSFWLERDIRETILKSIKRKRE